jgi:hypothetical protein
MMCNIYALKKKEKKKRKKKRSVNVVVYIKSISDAQE